MPSIDFKALREQVPVTVALRVLGWKHNFSEPAGLRGPCPIHLSVRAKSRTFCVGKGYWYCHACKKGGDAIALWAAIHRLPPYEAALMLCRDVGISPPLLSLY